MWAVARANSNIALVKYWGKRPGTQNLPAVGSVSLTLAGLTTRTSVRFEGALPEDQFELDGRPTGVEARARVSRFLDLVRSRAGITTRALVSSANDFPTASGLASSASGFAALAKAATAAAGVSLSERELSALARQGSGSAARSILGGFVEMTLEGYAEPLLAEDLWALRMVVAITTEGPKPISSSRAMEQTGLTSPYFAAWADSHAADMHAAKRAIETRDLAALGSVCELSCLKMHAAILAAQPGILFWNGATVEVLHRVRALRDAGIEAYFTIDAGPHVKVLCASGDAPAVERALQQVPGVLRTLLAAPGHAAELLEQG